jgi:hypothetical protein
MIFDILLENIWLIILFIICVFLTSLFLISFFRIKYEKNSKWKKIARDKLNNLELQKLDFSSQIIQLDKLIEYCLQSKFNRKATFAELLKKYKKNFSKQDLDEIWKSHKVRNKIAHDIDFMTDLKTFKAIIEIQKRQIKKLL